MLDNQKSGCVLVHDLKDPALEMYFGKSESALMHYYEPELGVFIAESPNVIMRAFHAGYEPISLLTEEEDRGADEVSALLRANCPELVHYVVPHEKLSIITGYPMTRGALCAFRRRLLPSLEEVCEHARRIVILEDVMNPTNLGAIFRSAAALNMDAIVMTDGCADPLYRRAARVSMGTVFQIPWTTLGAKTYIWPGEGVKRLHEMGFKTVSMALRKNSVDIDDTVLRAEEKLAIIMGTEAFGLSDETLDLSDYTVKIPMAAGVDSLNVAAASAIAFWELGKS